MKNTITQEIYAEIQLTLPERIERILERNRAVEGLVSVLRDAGFAKPIPGSVPHEFKAMGIATDVRSISAFSGVLYGITCLAVLNRISGKTVLSNDHLSRVETGDSDYLALDDRLKWKAYINLYSLLIEILKQPEDVWPEVIFLDLPLFLTRSQMLQSPEDYDEILSEWDELEHFIKAFWETDGRKLYPFNPSGPKLVSIIPKLNGVLFRGLRESGVTILTDILDEKATHLIAHEEPRLKQAGSGRVIERLLRPGERTVGFSLSSVLSDTRTQPTRIFERGVCAYLMRASSRASVWFVQVVGGVEDWREGRLDTLSSLIVDASLFDHEAAMPLPLFLAKRSVIFPQSVLEYMRRVVLEKFREYK